MGQRFTRSELVVVVAGGVALAGSFLPVWDNGRSFDTWDSLLFPIGTLIPISSVAAAVLVIVAGLLGTPGAPRVLGFGLEQIACVLALNATVLTVAFLAVERGGLALGVGYGVLAVAAVAQAIAAMLLVGDRDTRRFATGAGRRRRPVGREPFGPGEILIIAGAVAALVASGLPFYELESFTTTTDFRIWDTDFFFLFPVATTILLYAIASALILAIDRFGAASQSTRVLSFTPSQLSLACSVCALLLALAYLLQDREGITFGLELGIGYYLLLIAAGASVIGAGLVQARTWRTEAI